MQMQFVGKQVKFSSFGTEVTVVTDDRTADRFKMCTDLMGAPGQRAGFHQGKTIADAVQHPVQGTRALAVRSNDHFFSRFFQRHFNFSLFFPRTADSQRQIGFRQPVGAKSAGQKLGILAIARQQQDAAGVFVDPVYQSGTFFLFKFQTVKQPVDMKMRVGAALHGQPRRLVDRDHVVVFENYQTADEIDFLRRQFGAFFRRGFAFF